MQTLINSEMPQRQKARGKEEDLVNHKWIIILQIVKSWFYAIKDMAQNKYRNDRKQSIFFLLVEFS